MRLGFYKVIFLSCFGVTCFSKKLALVGVTFAREEHHWFHAQSAVKVKSKKGVS